MKRFLSTLFILATFVALSTACTGRQSFTTKSTVGMPPLETMKTWKKYLKVSEAADDKPINTTVDHISNVSEKNAVNVINQAMHRYQTKMPYKLATVFQLADEDELNGVFGREKKHTDPAVTAVVVQGHLYYIGFLDFPNSSSSLAMFNQVGGIIPAIAVVDGEDESKPAWIRTADEDGNPYQIKLHFSWQTSGYTDNNNITQHLQNFYQMGTVATNNTGSYPCFRIDNPKLEMDDNWRPYFVATRNAVDSNCDMNGTAVQSSSSTSSRWGWVMEHPIDLTVTDAQTAEVKSFKLDDPRTPQDERDPVIDKDYMWVDQIYSPKVMSQYIRAWGYNTDNYGITSTLNEFVMDGSHMDEVMNYSDTNIEFVAYIVSTHPDDSMAGVMCIDPREGNAIYYDMTGPTKAMATKSMAINVIRETINPIIMPGDEVAEFEVEDLNLHTIYGEHTWQGVISKPAYDHNHHRYGSVYCGTVLLRADAHLVSESVAHAETKHEALTKYQAVLFLKQSDRIGSNVLETKEIEGTITQIQTVINGGETVYLIKISGSDHQWEVPIDYVGDPLTEDVMGASVGDAVFMKYADIHNRKIHLTREFRDLTKGQNSASYQKPSAGNK